MKHTCCGALEGNHQEPYGARACNQSQEFLELDGNKEVGTDQLRAGHPRLECSDHL